MTPDKCVRILDKPMHYRTVDLTPRPSVLVGTRATLPQAIEIGFRYLAEHPESLDHVHVFQDHEDPNSSGPLLWSFNREDPGFWARLEATRAALDQGLPEDLRLGLP